MKSSARHIGHVDVFEESSHVTKQFLWKMWLQRMILLAGSISENASRQIEQLSWWGSRAQVRICLRPKFVNEELDA